MKLYFLPSSHQRRLRCGLPAPNRLFTANGEEIKHIDTIEVTPHCLDPVALHMDGTVEYKRSRSVDLRIRLLDVRVEVVTRRPVKKR